MAEKAAEKPKKTKQNLTDAERAKIPGWHEKWWNIAFRTANQTATDRTKMVDALNDLYATGSLAAPKAVIFMPSPLAAQIMAGYAATLFAMARNDALPTGDAFLKGFVADRDVPVYISLDGKMHDCATYLGVKADKGSKSKNEDGTMNAVMQGTAALLQYLRASNTKSVNTDQSSKIMDDLKKNVTNKPNQAMYVYTGATMFELLHANITQEAYQDVWNNFAQRLHQATSPTNDAVRREIETLMKNPKWNDMASKLDSRFGGRYAKCFTEASTMAQAMFTGGNLWGSGTEFISFYRQNCERLPIDKSNWDRWMCFETVSAFGGYRFSHEDFSVVTDFPEIIKLDEQNRLHGESGPSHRWRDGFQMFHWHGTRVPDNWITDKKSLTPREALGQSNLELRRSACEIMGWARILEELKARTIDKDPDPEIGELVEATIPGGNGLNAVTARFLRVKCGTGREFALGIPPGINTALDAQAWLAGFDGRGKFNRPEVRA